MNSKNRKKVILVVLDGWGHREEKEHNPIAEANTPYFDMLWKKYPRSLLEASGLAVGLPEGQAGGSEIGHLVIGAGKPIKTDMVRINDAIINKEFEINKAFLSAFDHVKKHDSYLHLCGLIGPGGIHAHSDHLFALIKAAKKHGVVKLIIHAFTDGRDTPQHESARFLKEIENVIEEAGIGFIGTISGRYYAMDRDNNWERFEKAEKAIFEAKSNRSSNIKPSEQLSILYKEDAIDEHLDPIVFLDENGKSYPISKNDGVILINFRADRARMFSQRVLDRKNAMNINYVAMTEYDKKFDCLAAFLPESIETTLAKEISNADLSQFHIAETEKYAHATYFLNGGQEEAHRNEARLMIESRKDVPTPDCAPELKAREITDATIEEFNNQTNFIFVNYANPDLVGHSGKHQAMVESIEAIDTELGRLVESAQENDYEVFITADHGNAEISFDIRNGENHTAHTNNPVPALLLREKIALRSHGDLSDIAPTILSLLDLPVPKCMTGKSLIKK
jgi:2,3-bisphosphoglycerate-independent phosphoglycerate mutase